jgi:hypothetical protein
LTENVVLQNIGRALTSVSNFLNGEGAQSSKLYELVNSGVEEFKNLYGTYFSSSISLITETLRNIGVLFPTNDENESPATEGGRTQSTINGTGGNQRNSGDFREKDRIIVNVDLTDTR